MSVLGGAGRPFLEEGRHHHEEDGSSPVQEREFWEEGNGVLVGKEGRSWPGGEGIFGRRGKNRFPLSG